MLSVICAQFGVARCQWHYVEFKLGATPAALSGRVSRRRRIPQAYLLFQMPFLNSEISVLSVLSVVKSYSYFSEFSSGYSRHTSYCSALR